MLEIATNLPFELPQNIGLKTLAKIKTADVPHPHVGRPPALTRSVDDVFKQHILRIEEGMPAAEDALFVADLGEVYRQHLRWKALLPRVEPFYAVKCNSDPMVTKLLAALGTGFDCASKAEIQQILNLGVESSRIIYANPCKQSSHIRFAADSDVRMMTFDNKDELYKIKRTAPETQLVLRILTDDSKSRCKLGLKFGASLSTTGDLLHTAKELGLNVIGVSFHVGSGCFDAHVFGEAVTRARRVFEQGRELGFNFSLLDVGGGFPGNNVKGGVTFTDIADILRPAIDKHFPPSVRVIAEPGRYYVSSAFTLAVNVTSRRAVGATSQTDDAQPGFMYYVNDGVYGSFNCLMFDHATVYPQVLCKDGMWRYDTTKHAAIDVRPDEPSFDCSIWGPTCDSIDCISAKTRLPELKIGDWMCFENMGAYTVCAASVFNGFQKTPVKYTNTEPAIVQV